MIIRIKNTFSPPRICAGCYWEALYTGLQQKHKRLRLELMTKTREPVRRGRPPATPREEEHHDDEVPDLVDALGTHLHGSG